MGLGALGGAGNRVLRKALHFPGNVSSRELGLAGLSGLAFKRIAGIFSTLLSLIYSIALKIVLMSSVSRNWFQWSRFARLIARK